MKIFNSKNELVFEGNGGPEMPALAVGSYLVEWEPKEVGIGEHSPGATVRERFTVPPPPPSEGFTVPAELIESMKKVFKEGWAQGRKYVMHVETDYKHFPVGVIMSDTKWCNVCKSNHLATIPLCVVPSFPDALIEHDAACAEFDAACREVERTQREKAVADERLETAGWRKQKAEKTLLKAARSREGM